MDCIWEMIAFFCPLSSILQIFLSFVKTKNIIVFKSLNISICICVLFIFNENCFFSYTIYPKQFPFLQLLLTPPTSTFFLLQCHSPSTSFQKREIFQRQQPNKMKQDTITRQTPSYQGWIRQPKRWKIFARTGKNVKDTLIFTVRILTEHQGNIPACTQRTW